MEIIIFIPTILWGIIALTYVVNDDFYLRTKAKRDIRGRYTGGYEKTIYSISAAKDIISLKRFLILSALIVFVNLIFYLIIWL